MAVYGYLSVRSISGGKGKKAFRYESPNNRSELLFLQFMLEVCNKEYGTKLLDCCTTHQWHTFN